MGLRFRQTFTLFPGVRLNIGKRGISASIGVPGATVNLSSRGIRATAGLAGSGLSYSANLMNFGNDNSSNTPQNLRPQAAQYYIPPQLDDMRPITSAGVEYLTSDSLIPLRDLIIKAREQRLDICADLLAARELATSQRDELRNRKNSLFRYFYKKKIAVLEESLPITREEIERLEEWEEQTHIKISFNASNYVKQTYALVEHKFATMAQSIKIWDITADRATNTLIERSLAGRTVERKLVKFDFINNDLLKFEGRAMRFSNANGNDILIYPGMALIPGNGGAFALIDLRELDIIGATSKFMETESVPSDAKIVGYTWAKCNKDGTADRRFKDNYQIPLTLYGKLVFRTNTGLNEEYDLSNAAALEAFAQAIQQHKQALQEDPATIN